MKKIAIEFTKEEWLEILIGLTYNDGERVPSIEAKIKEVLK